jgi:hypothetical protein
VSTYKFWLLSINICTVATVYTELRAHSDSLTCEYYVQCFYISHQIQTIFVNHEAFVMNMVDPITVMSYLLWIQALLCFKKMRTKWLSFCYLSMIYSLAVWVLPYCSRCFGWFFPFIDVSCFLEAICTLYVKHNGFELSALDISVLHCIVVKLFFGLPCIIY